jgi:5'-nucleotidase
MPDGGLRILCTNDDGINAPGLDSLIRIAGQLTEDVWTVAPETEQSATSHSLTLRRPLRVRHLAERRYSIDGTPTDCVVVALRKLVEGRRPDFVLSGVNHGANLGEDITYSGTVAAAMEAALFGVPAVAFSLMRRGDHEHRWATAEAFAPDVLRRLRNLEWPPGVLLNVNFPDLPLDKVKGLRVCHQGRRDVQTQVIEGHDPGGRPYLWIGDFSSDKGVEPESDLGVVEAGFVAVTPLHLDLTQKDLVNDLEARFR